MIRSFVVSSCIFFVIYLILGDEALGAAKYCTQDKECLDHDSCTVDLCNEPYNGKRVCTNQPIPGCCNSNQDCDDFNPCTKNICRGLTSMSTGKCSYKPILGCCNGVQDCNDFNPCTEDKCSSGSCLNKTIECEDGYVCVPDFGIPDYRCLQQCQSDQQCTEFAGSDCTFYYGTDELVCSYEPPKIKCQSSKDCMLAGGNECTYWDCQNGFCEPGNMTYCNLCESDADCAEKGANGPTAGWVCDLTKGVCENPKACSDDFDCLVLGQRCLPSPDVYPSSFKCQDSPDLVSCESDVDCSLIIWGNWCTKWQCGSLGYCEPVSLPECQACQTASDCTLAGYPYCNSDISLCVSYNHVCYMDKECNDDNPCTYDQCTYFSYFNHVCTHQVNMYCSNMGDSDGDGSSNFYDNCPDIFNIGQPDADHDGVGDKCDDCLSKYDPGQWDSDGDGVGDACDLTPYGG